MDGTHLYIIYWKPESKDMPDFYIREIKASPHFDNAMYQWDKELTEDLNIQPICNAKDFGKEKRMTGTDRKNVKYTIEGDLEKAKEKIQEIKNKKIKEYERKTDWWRYAKQILEKEDTKDEETQCEDNLKGLDGTAAKNETEPVPDTDVPKRAIGVKTRRKKR